MNAAGPADRYDLAKQERQRHVEAIIGAASRNKLVVAGPGTGKTFLFKTILKGKPDSLTLTFVNALVDDLALELFGLSDVRTLHGFARSQLQKITHRPVNVFPKLAQVINQDAQLLLGRKIDFDHLLHNRADTDPGLTFYSTRRRLYNHFGFADLIYATVLLFEREPKRIPTYSQVVVDEFQDFNALEVSLIDLLASTSPVLLAGDDDQSLYKTLKSADPKHIRDRHAGVVGDYASFGLPYCSRSSRVIVEAANDIITKAQERGLLQGRINKRFVYFESKEKDEVSIAHPSIIHEHVFSTQIAFFIQRQLAHIARQLRKQFTVLLLSPTRNQCRQIRDALRVKGFQNLCFAEKHEVEPSLLDGLKLLLLDKDCNLGWRVVARSLMDATAFEAFLRSTEAVDQTAKLVEHVSVEVKKQVREMLRSLRKVRDDGCLQDDKAVELFKRLGVNARAAATQALQDDIASASPSFLDRGLAGTRIVCTTIQSSKGLAADYVFITHCDDRYLVKDKESGLSDQDVCSFLVALTRARSRVYLLPTDKGKTATVVDWIDSRRLATAPSEETLPVQAVGRARCGRSV